MQKIPTLFMRDRSTHLVCPDVTPGCEWVTAGEGVATRKFDGTCCLVEAGVLFKRFDAKHGKTPPANFVPAQLEPDPNTGHWPGWIPVGDGPEDKRHREAFAMGAPLEDGTYELVGPKINSNPDMFEEHTLVRHGSVPVDDVPRDFDGLREASFKWFVEGVVWHHPDGRMVKIKRKDFWR